MYYPERNIKYDLNPEIWGIEENLYRSSDNAEEDFSIGKYADFERQDQTGNAPLMGAYPLEIPQVNIGTTGQGNASQGAAQGTQVPGTGTSGFTSFTIGNEPQPLTSMGSEALGIEPMMPMNPPMPNMWPQAQWSNQGMGFPPYNPYMQQGIGPVQPGMIPMQQGIGPVQQEQWNMPQMGAYPPYLMSTLGQTNLPMMPAMPIIPGTEASMGFQMNEPYPFGLWCYPMPNPYMMNQGMLPGYPFMMNQGMFPGSPFMGPIESSEEFMPTDQEPSTEEGIDEQGLMRHKKHKKKKKKVNKYSYYNCDVYGNPCGKGMQQHYDPCNCYQPMPYMWLSPFMHDMKDDGCCHPHHHHHHR